MADFEKFEVRNRWTSRVQFTAEITCSPDASVGVKLGLAVRWARRSGADLSGADLRGADLRGAVLSDAVLRGAVLSEIRNDLWDVLLRAQPEVPALLEALRSGRVNGSTYEGECACLAGTIANARHVPYRDLGFADPSRPIERWFLGIKEGDTPENNQIAKIAEVWIVEFQTLTAKTEAA